MPFPYDRHPQLRFEDLFPRDAEATIRAMDAAGDDIPYQKPRWSLPIESAGVERERVPVRIADPFRAGGESSLSCKLKVATRVPPDKRGLHMSRLNHLIADAAARPHASLEEFALGLAEEINRTQYGGPSTVSVQGFLPYWEHVPGRGNAEGKVSLEEVELTASARTAPGAAPRLTSGIGFDHITACPCVQKTFAHAHGGETGGFDGPFLTHSQRSRSLVQVSGHKSALPLPELLTALDRVAFRTQNTLPREHELALVYRAHQAPQFIEDVVRALVVAAGKAAFEAHPAALIEVSSRSMESIHAFDIFANASGRAEDVAKWEP